ncbi:MAG: flagellar basal body protein [Pseudolabrys sp.]|jgi:hypothetical protein
MSIAFTIAVSGLSVASLRLRVAASNIANASSDGPLPGTPNLENFPPAYRAPFQRRPRAVCRTTRAVGRGEMPAKVMLRAPGRMAVLLLAEPAISLRAAVPTARLHARRLAQPTIGQAGRYRRPVEALFARGDTNLLFTTATHRRGKSRRGREQGVMPMS